MPVSRLNLHELKHLLRTQVMHCVPGVRAISEPYGLAIFVTVIAYNVLGDVLRDIVDPKMQTR